MEGAGHQEQEAPALCVREETGKDGGAGSTPLFLPLFPANELAKGATVVKDCALVCEKSMYGPLGDYIMRRGKAAPPPWLACPA